LSTGVFLKKRRAHTCAAPTRRTATAGTAAENINVVALYPWLMLPVVPVILVVLAFNFLGDGLRDAADPYT
jgi:ABC-type dipeptide/oligopeptide/nickel transport system permease subunit